MSRSAPSQSTSALKLPLNWREIGRLGLSDWWHDHRMSLLLVASVTSVIAPLLLLFGLKSGVINQLLLQLRQDPANLEVRIRGNWSLDEAWLQALKTQPFVGFAVPLTRSLNLTVDLRHDSRRFAKAVQLLPTATGDPLLPQSSPIPATWDQLIISQKLADKLQLAPGDTIQGLVTRIAAKRSEVARLTLKIINVVESKHSDTLLAFVSPSLLSQIEAYKDGQAIPAWRDAPTNTTAEKPAAAEQPAASYAKARVYARSLEQVAPLVAYLEQQNLPVRSRQAAIEEVQAISFVLGTIFWVVAATAITGGIAAMVGAFIANVERKRKELAMLRLLGFGRAGINGFLLLQALLTATLAFCFALLLSQLGCGMLEQQLAFAAGDEISKTGLCRAQGQDLIVGLFLTELVAGTAALVSGLRAATIEPAEVLREQ